MEPSQPRRHNSMPCQVAYKLEPATPLDHGQAPPDIVVQHLVRSFREHFVRKGQVAPLFICDR